jgi:hypothetical protein
MIEKEIKDGLNEYYFLKEEYVVELFEPLCEYGEELMLILELSQKSKMYNYIKVNNLGYYVPKDKGGLIYFFDWFDLTKDSTELFGKYVYCDGESILAREVFN